MKNLLSFVATAMMAGSLTLPAQITNTVVGGGGVVPDNNPSGFASSVTIGPASGIDLISGVGVTLNLTGGYNGDLYAYVTHNGSMAILLNRIGTTGSGTFGFGDPGMSVLFRDENPNIHTFGNGGGFPLTGTFGSDGRFADPSNLNAVFSATPSRFLSTFNNTSANGTWTLFVADLDGGFQSTVSSWTLAVTGVPEPSVNAAFGIFCGIFALRQGSNWWKRKTAAHS